MTSKWIIAGLLVSIGALGCTKTVMLREDQPLVVTAQPPKPPPPPPPPPKRVEVKKEKIQVNEKIHFEFDSAEIKEESHDLLNEIAQVINDHPEILKLRIEGHTDNVGSAKYNQDLSQRRAAAVRDYLVDTGKVDAGRLEVAGYGFDKPIADNSTDEGRAKNRRVEFNILERADEGSSGEAPATQASDTTPAPAKPTTGDTAAPATPTAPTTAPAAPTGASDATNDDAAGADKASDGSKPEKGGAQ